MSHRLIPNRVASARRERALPADEYQAFLTRHEQWCQSLREFDLESQRSFDKQLVALSGGGLGITLALLNDLVGDGPILSPWAFQMGCLALIISLVLALLSSYTSHRGIQALLAAHANGPCDTESNAWLSWTHVLNRFSAVLCVVGIALVTLFSTSNFSEKVRRNAQGSEAYETPAISRQDASAIQALPQSAQGQGAHPSGPSERSSEEIGTGHEDNEAQEPGQGSREKGGQKASVAESKGADPLQTSPAPEEITRQSR